MFESQPSDSVSVKVIGLLVCKCVCYENNFLDIS